MRAARPTPARGPLDAAERKSPALAVELSAELVEAVAARVVELLAERDAERSEPWLSVRDAAAYIAAPPSRVYALVSAGRIPHRKDGSRTLFRRSELDAWLDRGGGKRP